MLLLVGLAAAASPTVGWALDLTVNSGVVEDCPSSGTSGRFDGGALAYAEPLPVLALTKYGAGHYDPRAGQDIGVGIGYGEVSGDLHGLCVGLFDRVEYHADLSKDLLDVLVGNHFGRTFDSGRIYRLAGTEQSFRADGARLQKTFDLTLGSGWSAKLGLAASYLHATEGDEQSLDGRVTATSADYAIGTATWVRTQSDLDRNTFNPFVAAGTPRGKGFSTDAELVIDAPRGDTLTLEAMDALGRIYWSEVPHSVRTLLNTSITYNANLDRDAFINGIDSRVSFVQHIPTKLRLAVDLPIEDEWSADLEDDEVEGFNFPSFGPSFGNPDRGVLLHYDVRTQAVELGGHLAWLTASLATNSFRLDRASALAASLRLSHTW
ncbi:MAG: hypothetical protein ACREU2_01785 [Steroidobacteraceae bacterium]